MKLPDLLIAVDCSHLLACMVLPDGLPEIIETIDYEHDGQTSAPAIDLSDKPTGCRVIAERISSLILRYRPSAWGLVCPPDLRQEILPGLTAGELDSLVIVREQTDVSKIDVCNITKVFDDTAPEYDAVKEHC